MLHATRRTRRFAVGAKNVCLVGENPMCSVPGFGREGLWSYGYGQV